MSIVILNYIIVGQYLLAVVFKYFPIYGYEYGFGHGSSSSCLLSSRLRRAWAGA